MEQRVWLSNGSRQFEVVKGSPTYKKLIKDGYQEVAEPNAAGLPTADEVSVFSDSERVQSLENELSRTQQHVQLLADGNKEHEATIAEKDTEIANLTAQVDQVNGSMATLRSESDKAIATRDATIADLQRQLQETQAEKDTAIADLQRQLAEAQTVLTAADPLASEETTSKKAGK